MRRFLLALSAAAAVALAPSTAVAADPLQVAVVDADLVARVQVTVTIEAICDPLIYPGAPEAVTDAIYGAKVTIDQAAGRAIAHAEGGDLMVSRDHPITCDGESVNRLSMSAISSTVPFHGGKAIVSVAMNVDDPDCPWCGGARHVEVVAAVKLN